MPERPSGTVTFLFTDIEGSTRLLGSLGTDRYRAALEEHRVIIREALARHAGHEVVTEGDSFVIVFQRAIDAVRAAEEVQRGLAAHQWPANGAIRVRAALHTTDVDASGESYVGLGLHRGARIAAAGHGGQVLVSQATAQLLRDEPGITLGDLGEYRLKDLPEPQRIYQLQLPGLPADFPPIRAPSVLLTNLAGPLTSFIGRERELAELRQLTAKNRLVTLIGVGGTGKTRLMIETGAVLADRFPDGVWLAELAPIGDPELVPAQVARGLGLSEEPGRTPVDTLLDYVAAKSLLILLDNCEHLIEAAGELATRLLNQGSSVAILASSREALGVEGEVVFQVPSLAVPDPADGDPTLETVAASEAVRLFIDRARAALSTFELTPANARVVLDICHRLDGIPLAIELAAARVPVLSVDEIDAGLGDRFRLLTGGRRGALPRQQTLQALIDWSWNLLTESDRRLLARLSVFASSWSLEAATQVVATADGDPPDRIGTLDGLARLVDRSLVRAEPAEETRYRMLETIRQYARDRLVGLGDAERMREAHLAYYLDLGLRAEHPLFGPEMIAWLDRLDREKDELRTALDWGLEADPERAMRLTVALLPYWRARAFGSEALDAVIRAAGAADTLPPPPVDRVRDRAILLARVFAAAAHSESVWGSGLRAPAWADRAVALANETDDLEAKADALGSQAMAAVFSGHVEHAVEMHDAVVRLAEQRGDAWMVTMIEAGAALALLASGSIDEARARQVRASDAARASGNPFAIAFATLNQGRIAGWAGRADEARLAFDEAEALYRLIGDRRFVVVVRSDRAHALRRSGVLDEAETVYRETIRAWQHLGSRGAIANQLESFGFLALAKGDAGRAARLLGAAEALRERAGASMLAPERVEYDRAVAQLRSSLDSAALEDAWAAGRAMSMDDAIAFAAGS